MTAPACVELPRSLTPSTPSTPPSTASTVIPVIPVVVVQRHRVLREAVQVRLDAEQDLEVIASVETVEDAVASIARHPGAVVVLDEPPASASCRDVMEVLRSTSHDARAVMLLTSTGVGVVAAAANAGVDGVLCRDTPTSVLVQAVRTVAGGACVLDASALRQLAGTWQPLAAPTLSRREREVLAMLADDLTNAEIASKLYVSTETVKTHVAHLLRKLDVPNRSAAVDAATRLGLLGR
jgi:DNA-binding NarL/FixJ family response regulator